MGFFVAYVFAVFKYQTVGEYQFGIDVVLYLLGFVLGFLSLLAIAFTYFINTNKDIFKLFNIPIDNPIIEKQTKKITRAFQEEKEKTKRIKVTSYFSSPIKVKRVRSYAHYTPEMLSRVFKQNHANALIIEFIGVLMLFGFGAMMDVKYFLIPAAASSILLFTILLSLSGAFTFWLKGWQTTGFIILFLLMSALFRVDKYYYRNQAFGLDYSMEAVPYSVDQLKELSSPKQIEADKLETIQILDNWKSKVSATIGKNEKPKLVLINTSGGGIRSAVFSSRMLQALDSLSSGRLMDQVFMMSGASGGMIGLSYMRELYQMERKNEIKNWRAEKYALDLSRDLLNPVIFGIVSNDLFVPWQRFEINGKKHIKDRGYLFEKHLHKNTRNYLNKTLGYYVQAEKEADIPLVVLGSTITSDGRRLLFSPQGLSYLTISDHKNSISYSEIDGVEFKSLFENNDPLDLQFSSALRANATFPFILPNIYLPTEPKIELMDAGFRDNTGLEISLRFVNTFSDWINENTEGVVMVQLIDHKKLSPIDVDQKAPSLLDKITSPFDNVLGNWKNFEDYDQDLISSMVSDKLHGNIDFVYFEYYPEEKEKRAAMSFHLTSRERDNIFDAVGNEKNIKAANELMDLIELSSEAFLTKNSKHP